MNVAVWDTHVTREDGVMMNFDVIVPESETDAEVICGYAQSYLKSKAINGCTITSEHCSFCHVESPTEAMIESIKRNNFYIIELKNCQ